MSKIMHFLEKMESPQEDELWRELYENVEFTDDVNGGNALDKDKVARSSQQNGSTLTRVTEDIAQDWSGVSSNVTSVWTCMRQLRLWRL